MSKKKNRESPKPPITHYAPAPVVVLDAFSQALASIVDRVHYEPSDDEVCLTARNRQAM